MLDVKQRKEINGEGREERNVNRGNRTPIPEFPFPLLETCKLETQYMYSIKKHFRTM